MDELTQAQVDAVLAHLSAEYDAAEAQVRARDYGFWNGDQGATLGKAVHDSGQNNLRALRAAADRHPERFAQLAADAEHDLRDLAGYSQQATVQQVLRDTATATAVQVKDAAVQVADAAGGIAGFALGTIWGALPLAVKVTGAVVVLGAAYFYLRPLLPHRAAAAA